MISSIKNQIHAMLHVLAIAIIYIPHHCTSSFIATPSTVTTTPRMMMIIQPNRRRISSNSSSSSSGFIHHLGIGTRQRTNHNNIVTSIGKRRGVRGGGEQFQLFKSKSSSSSSSSPSAVATKNKSIKEKQLHILNHGTKSDDENDNDVTIASSSFNYEDNNNDKNQGDNDDDNDDENINFNLSLAYQEEQTQNNKSQRSSRNSSSITVDADRNNSKDQQISAKENGSKKVESSTQSSSSSSWTDWSAPASSLGSLLLKRKRIEEEEIKKKIQDLSSSSTAVTEDDDNDNDYINNNDLDQDNQMILFQDDNEEMMMNNLDFKGRNITEIQKVIDGLDFNGKNITEVQKEIDQAIKSLASEAEETIVSFIDLTKGRRGRIDGIGSSGSSKRGGGRGEVNDDKRKDRDDASLEGLNQELVKEVDESIHMLTSSRQNLMKDIEVLPSKSVRVQLQEQQQQQEVESDPSESQLPLSGPSHTARIEHDMKQLAVSIASTVENAEQWKIFTDDGGGLVPLLECIRDGAKEIENGPWENDLYYDDNIGMISLVEKREEAFAAACRACKTIRDLCTISKPFASMITDSILRADAVWSVPVKQKDGKTKLDGGLISNLITLLRFSQQSDKLYNSESRRQKIRRAFGNRGVQRLGNRRQKRNARKRCGLYVTQLLLEMSFASDKAVDVFRATSRLTETVLECSSYAQAERLRRRWIRYPIEVVKRIITKKSASNEEKPFLAAASVNSGIAGQTQGSANQLLAAIGHNVWYPKTAGQKGLRILCLDGGGTRGITAISSMRSIVNAIGGVEVCDAFDMIVGTSTGAIIAFLVGLRRESSAQARKRYDKLISRIFVKSALSTPMLLFTTATYDETPFNNVIGEILRDSSMLSSRADPRVPLVFAVSSKMSSTPTQICLFRNYNYGGGEMSDAFVMDPIEAKKELGLEMEDDLYKISGRLSYDGDERIEAPRSRASRHPGSFRVLQRAALRATTAAPTVFKPVLMGGELYCDGGIVASNPTAVAIHEARTIYPNVPIELVVSCGTGAFEEEKSAPRIGWDGIIGQIVNSATDGEQVHHVLEDILGGQGSTARLGRSLVSRTKYFRFQPIIGTSDTFPIDGTDPTKLEELSQITTDYMNEPEQVQKLNEIVDILSGKTGWKRRLLSKIGLAK